MALSWYNKSQAWASAGLHNHLLKHSRNYTYGDYWKIAGMASALGIGAGLIARDPSEEVFDPTAAHNLVGLGVASGLGIGAWGRKAVADRYAQGFYESTLKSASAGKKGLLGALKTAGNKLPPPHDPNFAFFSRDYLKSVDRDLSNEGDKIREMAQLYRDRSYFKNNKNDFYNKLAETRYGGK